MTGTGIADWPVSYAEIEPYYTQAEWEIGISGPTHQHAADRADVQALSAAGRCR